MEQLVTQDNSFLLNVTQASQNRHLRHKVFTISPSLASMIYTILPHLRKLAVPILASALLFGMLSPFAQSLAVSGGKTRENHRLTSYLCFLLGLSVSNRAQKIQETYCQLYYFLPISAPIRGGRSSTYCSSVVARCSCYHPSSF